MAQLPNRSCQTFTEVFSKSPSRYESAVSQMLAGDDRSCQFKVANRTIVVDGMYGRRQKLLDSLETQFCRNLAQVSATHNQTLEPSLFPAMALSSIAR